MKLDNNQSVFFELLRAGLWEKEARLSRFDSVDFNQVYQIAKEQTVIGLIAAGLEHVSDAKVPKEDALMFVGVALQLVHRNQAMNQYINRLFKQFEDAGIYTLLLKGQGIAQCYERPLWRAAGDVDCLLNAEDYEKGKKLLLPYASKVETEYTFFKHLGMKLGVWEVELHGTLKSRLSKRIDDELDRMQEQIFELGEVRVWNNAGADIHLPAPNMDIVFIFTHILHHFFFEGIGLRQLCDWCRLLWVYHGEIDAALLEKRLRKMGVLSEWKAFAAYCVDYLGMPVEAMLLYSNEIKWRRKAQMIGEFVLKVGNFGNNQRRDYSGLPYYLRKFKSFFVRLSDILRHFRLFPKDSFIFFAGVLWSGFYAVVKGE